MRIVDANVPRRKVIEAYLDYDAEKKQNQLPDFAHCNWADPNCLDNVLRQAKYKYGIIAGFSEWNQVVIGLEDLRDCAVVEAIANKFKGPRDLRGLETKGSLYGWKPDRETSWFKCVERGDVFGPREPFILREAVKGEFPAKWYVEDGSGRATAMIAYAAKYTGKPAVAYGFLGIRPDRSSNFMKENFAFLL
jgi:hypothetical protein